MIDFLIVVLFVGGLVLGFFQGTLRMGIMLLGFYLSVVLSLLYYPLLGGWLLSNFGGTAYVSQYIAFFILLIVSFLILVAAGWYTFRYVEIRGPMQYIDKFIGVFLGIGLGSFAIGILSLLLWNLMVTRGGCGIGLPLFGILCDSVQSSFLLRYFANDILPGLYTNVEAFLPAGAEYIFGPIVAR